MKTLTPDLDAMNDVSPVEDQDDTSSVDTAEDVPASIDDVAKLPENLDKEMVQPLPEAKASKFLNTKRGRRTKKDRFQGSHQNERSPTPNRRRSSRLCRHVEMMDVLDPVKAKLDDRIDAHEHARNSKQKADDVKKPILESKGEKDL